MTICGCLWVLVIAPTYFGERTKEPVLNIIERSSYIVVEVGAFVNPQNSCFYPETIYKLDLNLAAATLGGEAFPTFQ